MDLYDGLAKLYKHLVYGGDWSEDEAAGYVDSILHDNRTRAARIIALREACEVHGLDLEPRIAHSAWEGEIVTVAA